MIATMPQKRDVVWRELQNLPEVEYPREVVERWKKEAEIARMQLAAGEIAPMTVEEFATMKGIALDD